MKFDASGDMRGVEPVSSGQGSVAQSPAPDREHEAKSVAQSLTAGEAPEAAAETPRDAGFNQPTSAFIQEVASLTQQDRLERAEAARGALVKRWRQQAACQGSGKDFRGLISGGCMVGIAELMQADGEIWLHLLTKQLCCVIQVLLFEPGTKYHPLKPTNHLCYVIQVRLFESQTEYHQLKLNPTPEKQEWFARRQLKMKPQLRPDAPTTVKNDHWTYYAREVFEKVEGDLKGVAEHDPNRKYCGSVPIWRPAYHGTWFYGLWNLLLTGQISPSSNLALGHDFNSLGMSHVYCSPKFDTAIGYARPQNVFGDGVYHFCVLELRVDLTRRHRRKKLGGEQWTFESDAVVIVGVWICSNCGNPKGEEHLRFWVPEDECIPLGCSPVRGLFQE